MVPHCCIAFKNCKVEDSNPSNTHSFNTLWDPSEICLSVVWRGGVSLKVNEKKARPEVGNQWVLTGVSKRSYTLHAHLFLEAKSRLLIITEIFTLRKFHKRVLFFLRKHRGHIWGFLRPYPHQKSLSCISVWSDVFVIFGQRWKCGEQSPLHDDLGPLRGPGLSRPSWECLCQSQRINKHNK